MGNAIHYIIGIRGGAKPGTAWHSSWTRGTDPPFDFGVRVARTTLGPGPSLPSAGHEARGPVFNVWALVG